MRTELNFNHAPYVPARKRLPGNEYEGLGFQRQSESKHTECQRAAGVQVR
jgi:hypothetical protein